MVVRLLERVERAGGEHVRRLGRPSGDPGELLLRGVESGLVDPQILLGDECLGHLDRQPVGREQVERRCAVDHLRPGRFRLLDRRLQVLHPVFDRAEELLLLLADHVLDADHALLQVGIRLLHRVGHDRHQRVQERLVAARLGTHPVGIDQRPPEQQSHDVGLLIRAGPYILVDAEAGRADVVGDPADGDPLILLQPLLEPARLGVVGLIFQAQSVGGGVDDGAEDVDVEVRPHALHGRRHPLQAHAGVDVVLRQWLQLARPHAVELREHEVPDLDFLDAVAVVENLRAGAAHAVGPVSGGAGRPEVVVLAHAGDAAGRDLDLPVPDVERLVVVQVDRDRQALAVDLQRVGQELPRPVDRFLLEVIAEREVAEHLEERHVPRGLPYVLDVARADALLAGGGLGEARVAQAHELALELIHPGRGEQDRRVVGHEHVGGLLHAPLGREEIEVGFAKLVGSHGRAGSRSCGGRRIAGLRGPDRVIS